MCTGCARPGGYHPLPCTPPLRPGRSPAHGVEAARRRARPYAPYRPRRPPARRAGMAGGPRPRVPQSVRAASWARTCCGRFVIIASTPSRAQSSTSAGSSTVQTCTRFPARAARATYPGCARRIRMLGPAIRAPRGQPAVPMPGREDCIRIDGGQLRRSGPHAVQGTRREAHDPYRRAPAARRAEAVQQGQQPLLDLPRPAGRVLGLDRQLDRPARVATSSSSRSRVSTEVRSASSGRATRTGRAGSCGSLLPGAEVQLRQVGQFQGGDGAAAVGRTVDPAVVHADEMAVGGESDIALQGVGPVLDGFAVGGQRVFGRVVGRPRWAMTSMAAGGRAPDGRAPGRISWLTGLSCHRAPGPLRGGRAPRRPHRRARVGALCGRHGAGVRFTPF